jgi:hypothetical protein
VSAGDVVGPDAKPGPAYSRVPLVDHPAGPPSATRSVGHHF